MSKVSSYKHFSQTTGTSALSTSFSAVRTHDLASGDGANGTIPSRWTGFLESLQLTVDTIAGGCASLTVRVTSDVTGDVCIIPDTAATIATGVTTATKGTVVYVSGIAFTNDDSAQTDAVVYVWVKTDAGTCNLRVSNLVWSE